MNVPAHLKYTEEHEWVSVEGKLATVGITEFAQGELGDIVFVELPKVGATVSLGQPFGSVESVKTVSELYAPVTGKVVKVNEALTDAPERINASPYEDGWMIVVEIENDGELEKLWTAEKYIETYGD
ncbi:glycine cleavage system protein GcvH [Paenibacillus sp.]|uniref:glycine cleavage system protein GcvH n=1 Tax=Paenibacillus sp. TaxID=58172 RepID=UPI002D55A673|nr:glycine cleavage system protein GcvH [Paenibacillus sp.]HZG83905.1 glycine cleavage system protein GcvH [Paenibacillus sp.]